MRIFGSLTAFKDLLSSFATTIGTAAGTTSASVTLASGNASVTSGDVTVKSGSIGSGTRGALTLGGGIVTATATSSLSLIAPTSLIFTTPLITLSTVGQVTAGTSITLTAPSVTIAGSAKILQGAYTATFVAPATATYTLPAATGTLSTLANIETLTNKAVRSSAIAPLYNATLTYAIGDIVTDASFNLFRAYALPGAELTTNAAKWEPIVQAGEAPTVTGIGYGTVDCQLGNTFTSTVTSVAATAVAVTLTATDNSISLTSGADHGMVVGQALYLSTIVTSVGLTTYTTYYVRTVLSSKKVTVAASPGGALVTFSPAGTGTMIVGKTFFVTNVLPGHTITVNVTAGAAGVPVYFVWAVPGSTSYTACRTSAFVSSAMTSASSVFNLTHCNSGMFVCPFHGLN